MKLFDLHCDTPLELYRQKKGLIHNNLHISLEKASVFDKYIQCAAIWSDSNKEPEQCFCEFTEASENFISLIGNSLVTTRESLEKANKDAFILCVEDARLLCNDLSRLQLLFDKGVRVLTLLWKNKSEIGSSWNTDGSLTPFGIKVLEGCFDLGIIPDLSHANDKSCACALKYAKEWKKPVIATHSNSRRICRHERNIPDLTAREIAQTGGVIGISLYPPHLRGETAEISDIIKHTIHLVNAAGTDSVCLGCDFDGIDKTPEGINDVKDLTKVYDSLTKALGSFVCEKIFFYNAYNFFLNNLPKER